jgi:hypothetical protein
MPRSVKHFGAFYFFGNTWKCLHQLASAGLQFSYSDLKTRLVGRKFWLLVASIPLSLRRDHPLCPNPLILMMLISTLNCRVSFSRQSVQ